MVRGDAPSSFAGNIDGVDTSYKWKERKIGFHNILFEHNDSGGVKGMFGWFQVHLIYLLLN